MVCVLVGAAALGGLYYHWGVMGPDWFDWFYTINPLFVYAIAIVIPVAYAIIGYQLKDPIVNWISSM